MFKRVKLIQGIGNFSQTRAGNIEFAPVNILYAENRSGKSTLCDILQSLSINSPDLVHNRKAIPDSANNPPKVDFQFDSNGTRHVASFDNGAWGLGLPSDSNLFVFDHSFIHRNVITGQKPERHNSENVTSFILGEENAALFKNLADLNNSLRTARSELSNLDGQFRSHDVANVPEYSNSALPSKTEEVLKTEVDQLKRQEEEAATIVLNSASIKARKTLSSVANQTKFSASAEAINEVLNQSLQNIHKDSLEVLNHHINQHVDNEGQFKAWASQGEALRKDDSCPFCGQALGQSEQALLGAYQQVFNEEFENYGKRIRQSLDGLRQPFTIPDTKEHITQYHQSNLSFLALYQEPAVLSDPSLASMKSDLEAKFQDLLVRHDALITSSNSATQYWKNIISQKYSSPYESLQNIDFSGLLSVEAEYNQAIFNYWEVVEKINSLLNQFKSSLDDPALQQKATTLAQQRGLIENQIKRIDLESLCLQYRTKHSEILQLEASYEQKKEALKNSQSVFLETYFDLVNSLFRELGSHEFEILKVPNNRGKQVVYELKVKFKGYDIPPDKVNFVFSESDRRALALCFFLAKVLSLDTEEQGKSILVLDDPVTSFDNERITLILNKFGEILPLVKQLMITTHYKGMASKAAKQFRQNAKSIKLTHGEGGIEFEEVGNDYMMATDHDLCFDRIKAFVDRATNDNISTVLRPFLEQEIRTRFKKQLSELGHGKSDLSVCIDALRDNNVISLQLASRLSQIRSSLNSPMHDVTQDAIENTRSVAKQILEVVYDDLTPAA
ncbi:AAA family ATPase [Porticoccaceae bacterium]|nr:AAA family ATPase [Porticoccaceae bacterium]MDB2663604.1 AAA family ATPase [Porticoccaceae bacterium]